MKTILFQLSTTLLLLTACTTPEALDASPQPTPKASAISAIVEQQATTVSTLIPTNRPRPTETAVPTPAVDPQNNKPILYYNAADGHYYRIGLDGGPPNQLTQQQTS